MTQEPASNDYKHLERDVKALDFFALALAFDVAFALGRMTTGTHEPLETLFLYGLGLSEDERSEEMTLFRQKKTSRIKNKIKQNNYDK